LFESHQSSPNNKRTFNVPGTYEVPKAFERHYYDPLELLDCSFESSNSQPGSFYHP
jgi:hypothetical protein